jgi:cyclic pyranopterin phosphate synthase
MKKLTHLDARGHARVVDVGDKASTKRRAEARATVNTTRSVARAIAEGRTAKGDVAAVARIAAIQACKRTSELVPLCHPIALTHVAVTVTVKADRVHVDVVCECVGPTGVEMEALTGASVGALAIYDMIKALDRGATIATALRAKSGGKSGDFVQKSGSGSQRQRSTKER